MPLKVHHVHSSFTEHPLKHYKQIVDQTSARSTYTHTSPTPSPASLPLSFSSSRCLSLTRTSLGVSRPPSPPPLFLAIWREGAESGPALFSALSLHCLRSAEPGPVIVFCSSSSSLVSRLLECERSAAAVQGPFFALHPSLCLLFFPNSLSLSLYVCPSASLRTQFI